MTRFVWRPPRWSCRCNNPYGYRDIATTWHVVGHNRCCRNSPDETYQHPGLQLADGIIFSNRLPQPGRTVFLRLRYRI